MAAKQVTGVGKITLFMGCRVICFCPWEDHDLKEWGVWDEGSSESSTSNNWQLFSDEYLSKKLGLHSLDSSEDMGCAARTLVFARDLCQDSSAHVQNPIPSYNSSSIQQKLPISCFMAPPYTDQMFARLDGSTIQKSLRISVRTL